MKFSDRGLAKNHIGEPYPVVCIGREQGGRVMSQRG